jgi:acyl-CoA thioester hydrolase
MTEPTEAHFTTALRTRYADCDHQGVVFNARWFELFSVATGEFWRELIGGYEHLPRSFGVETVVAETGARFRGTAGPDQLIDFTVRPARIGTSSLRIEIDASREGQLIAEGFTEYVFVDRTQLQPAPIPEPVKKLLAEPTANG